MPLVAYFGVGSNDCLAFLADMSEQRLVALDAVWLLIGLDVALSGEAEVALEAGKVALVPIEVHRLRVLGRENQLQRKQSNTKQLVILEYIILIIMPTMSLRQTPPPPPPL